MEYKEMTTTQLREEVKNLLEKATTEDLKWIYSYYKGFDGYPLLIDQPKHNPDEELYKTLAPGRGVWADGEEVPI